MIYHFTADALSHKVSVAICSVRDAKYLVTKRQYLQVIYKNTVLFVDILLNSGKNNENLGHSSAASKNLKLE